MKLRNKQFLVKQNFIWNVLIILIGSIQFATFYPNFVEKLYSTHLYVGYAQILRWLTGWLPFSLGDVLYILIGLYLCYSVIRLIKICLVRKNGAQIWLILKNLLKIVVVAYVWFMLSWGLNYHRLGIAYQLHLQVNPYTNDELCVLRDSLAVKLNSLRQQIGQDSILPSPDLITLYWQAPTYYQQASKLYPFIQYHYRSIKNSLFTPWAKYFGWGGYYNPFTGEAQIRADMPRILIPYTVLHEMAHQIGYAGEEEANFVGYLVARESGNAYVAYSCYSELYKYVYNELLLRNTFSDAIPALDTLVRNDFKRVNRFFMQEQNSIAPQIMDLYDVYLRANQQKNGINSYNEVVGLLIAFQKKYKKI